MKIVHRLSLSVSSESKRAFAAVGVELDDGFTTFTVHEADPRWPQIAKLVGRFHMVDVAQTVFSAEETESAAYLSVLTDSHFGYPEPSDDCGYLTATYDLADYCVACGCGLLQTKPFRAAVFPRPATKQFFQLNWVFDEIFVAKKTWKSVFKDFGIAKLPFLNARTGSAHPDFAQLAIPQTEIDLDLAGLGKETCCHCARTKYEPVSRGFFPSLLESTKLPLFRPKPYIGSGASAHRPIVISNELYRALKSSGQTKGLVFTPLADTRTIAAKCGNTAADH